MKRLLPILLCLPFIGFGQGENNYYNKGYDFLYGEKVNYQLAIDNFTKCINENPDNNLAYIFRGQAYSWLKLYEDAKSDYTIAIRIKPNDYWAYRYRALVKEKEGLVSACTDYKKACDLGDNQSCDWFYKCND
ncbi:hypothetical protein OAX32_02985 [Flavobacteriales bacterium]|nr:hypothetical protein [Flavobacteriales bacterium]